MGKIIISTLQCVLRMKEDSKCEELGMEPVHRKYLVRCYSLLLEIGKPIKNNQDSFKSKIVLLIGRLFLECKNYVQWIPHCISF